MKAAEEVVYSIEELMSDSMIKDSYTTMAKQWIGLIEEAFEKATAAAETVRKQTEEVEMEGRIWEAIESRSSLSLKEATAERMRVEAYLRGIVAKERELLASAEAGANKEVSGKRAEKRKRAGTEEV